MDPIEQVKQQIERLMHRVGIVEMNLALTMKGHEEHQTRVTEFIQRQEKAEGRDTEYRKEMTAKVDLLVGNDMRFQGMKQLVQWQWAIALGLATIVTTIVAIYVAVHR